MKWYYISLGVLIGVIIYLVVQLANISVSNSDVTKRIEQLQNENEILKEKVSQAEAQKDSAMTILLKSLTNTQPVNKKHDAKRKNILDLPTDSLLRIFNERIPAN